MHNDIDDHKLDNIFWDGKHLRLIDFGNAVTKGGIHALGLREATTYGHERSGVGKLLFKLLTGKSAPRPGEQINPNDWGTMSERTKDILEKTWYRKQGYDPAKLEGTTELLKDLSQAYSSLPK